MRSHYDVVIHGAGIPGQTLALLLARGCAGQNGESLSVLLVDRQQPDLQRAPETTIDHVTDYDLRVYALTESSRQCFQRAGIWPEKPYTRVYPYRHMTVWDDDEINHRHGEIHFDAADTGAAALGYMVEGRVISGWLERGTGDSADIDRLTDRLAAIQDRPRAGLALTMESGKTIGCRLLVGADGARSTVRELAGIDTIGWPYGQQAIVATTELSASHQATAWQRFLPDGPLALLPMQDPYCSIVWTATDSRARQLMEQSDTSFIQSLNEAVAERCGVIKAVSPRLVFPLAMGHARRYCSNRIALVADAAHVVHPLAGQGLNMGLRDVQVLSERIIEAFHAGRDIGEKRPLRAYERARKGDNWLMQLSFDGLKRLFGDRSGFASYLRNAGMSQLDKITPIKSLLARKAMN